MRETDTHGRRIICLLVTLTVVLGSSCGSKGVVGAWRQEAATACSIAYPSEIEFFRDGRYITKGLSLLWNGGSYLLVDRHRIRMDTNLGATMYQITVDGDRLIFTNETGCTFAYIRKANS